MKNSAIYAGVCLIGLLTLSGCSAILKGYVNKKYPPVSSMEKSAQSVETSLTTLDHLSKTGLGVRLSAAFLDNLLDSALFNALGKDSMLGIRNIGQLQFLDPPVFSLGKQEILVSANIRVTGIQNKYVKEVEMSLSGRIAPSFSGDTLLLAPSFSSLHLNTLDLTKCIILSGLAKSVINDLVSSFMNNINGALGNLSVEIHYPPLPAEPLSQLLAADAGIQVVKDDTFRLNQRRLDPVVLVDTAALTVLSDVVLDTGTAAAGEPPSPLVPTVPPNITNSQFTALYDQLDSNFWANWNLYLDTIQKASPPSAIVDISYATLSDMMDELWAKADFTLTYNFSDNFTFPQQTITLGQISEPDCSTIPFNYSPLDCSGELSNCGSCSWWNAVCWAGVAACEAANGLKYAGCEADNAARLAAASAEWAAAKALCYTEVAGVFVVDKLILPVGQFSGTASASGPITGRLNKPIPGGLESLGFTATLHADVSTGASLTFQPSGLAGVLLCVLPLPTPIVFNNHLIPVDVPPTAVNATMQRVTQNNQCILQVNTGTVKFPIQFTPQFITFLLQNQLLVLNCSLGIFLGVTVSSMLALTGNQTFKNYISAAFGGTYQWSFQKNLNVVLPVIPINTAIAHTTLSPGWGVNSLIYQKK